MIFTSGHLLLTTLRIVTIWCQTNCQCDPISNISKSRIWSNRSDPILVLPMPPPPPSQIKSEGDAIYYLLNSVTPSQIRRYSWLSLPPPPDSPIRFPHPLVWRKVLNKVWVDPADFFCLFINSRDHQDVKVLFEAYQTKRKLIRDRVVMNVRMHCRKRKQQVSWSIFFI